MKLKSQSQERYYVTLNVELSPEEVEQGLEKSYRKVVRQINVPGFRKGKFPRPMLEARYGVEMLYDEAVDALLPEAYEFVLKETNLDPIDRPEVDVLSFAKGQPAEIKFVVTVNPEVVLGEYKGIKVEVKHSEVSEAAVEAELKRLQDEHARLVPVESAAQPGDFIKLNFDGSVDGVAFEGGKAENYDLELGSNSFIPGFEDQLIGKNIDEEVTVQVTFPESYHAAELAGKDAVFLCKITEIHRKEILPLDDDFAKDVSDVETLAELKVQLENTLKETAVLQDKEAKRNAVLAKVVANAQVEIPEILISRQTEQMMRNFENSLMRQGLKLADYQKILGKTAENMKEDFKPQAEKAVRQTLVIDQITKVESIVATEEEIAKQVAEMAKTYQMEVDAFQKIVNDQGMYPEIAAEVAYKKTIEFLTEAAVE
ncbi:MAG: trigger factor [Negativicutes bacterium]|nr:trigger factor [Negativicutes bacterium]